MKKSLLFISATVLTIGSVFSQNAVSSDAGGVLTINPKEKTEPYFGGPNNKVPCSGAVTTGDNVCNPASGTVSATGGSFIVWYDAMTGGNVLDTALSYTSPVLTTTTSYYAEAVCVDTTMMGLPAHGSSFSGNTRGYWFVAPTDFIITGLRVPTDASATGSQSIEIMKFNTAPPLFSAVTNDFNVLGLFQNVANTTIINTFIPVSANDTIGILGWRGTTNSYAGAPYTTTINGMSVDLKRLGFQDDLDNIAAYDVWTESGGSISRTEMYYSIAEPAPRTAATITVSNCTGVNEVSFEDFISVYPNPSNGVVWVDNSSNDKIEIKVFDVTGNQISSIISSNASEKIDFSNFSNGSYFIQIISNNESLVKKIILNK